MVGMVEVHSGLQNACGEWPHRLALALWQQHKAMQGTDRRLHMNVGEGLDGNKDVDVNEPAWLGERERQEEKGWEIVNS